MGPTMSATLLLTLAMALSSPQTLLVKAAECEGTAVVIPNPVKICDAPIYNGSVITVLAPDEGIGNIFSAHIEDFEQQCGGIVDLKTAPYRDPPYWQTLRQNTKAKSGVYDIYVSQSTWLMENVLGLEDITDRIRSDAKIGWNDIFGNTQEFVAQFNSKVYMVPIDQDMMFVHYREDVRTALEVEPPETWDDLIAFARAAHNRDWNGDGVPDFGFCVASRPGGEAKWNFLTVFSTLVQAQGSNQGIYFDTDSQQPLWETEAAREAARIWVELSKYGPAEWNQTAMGEAYNYQKSMFDGCSVSGNSSTDCPFFRLHPRSGTEPPASTLTAWPFQWNSMAVGRCAASIDWAALTSLMHGTIAPFIVVQNKMKSALVGSPWVLDRATGSLVECTEEICPYSFVSARTGVRINRATFHASGGWGMGINTFASAKAKTMAYDFMRHISTNMQADVSAFATWVQPFRNSLNKLDVFSCTGVSDEYMQHWLSNHDTGLQDKNAAVDFRIPAGTTLAAALDEQLSTMLSQLSTYTEQEINGAISLFQTSTQSRWNVIMQDVEWGGLDVVLRDYKVSLGNRVVTQSDRDRCTAGQTFSPLSFLCEACERGRFMAKDGTEQGPDDVCEPCGPGTYINESACADCPASTYLEFGGLSIENCKPCNKNGEFSGSGAAYCSTAKAGFQPTAERTEEEPCPAGMTSAPGDAECSRCPAGYVAPLPGMAACQRCSPASYLVASADASECQCAPTFVPDGTLGTNSSTVELRCTCGAGDVLDTITYACVPCGVLVAEGYEKLEEYGTAKSLCKYASSGATLSLFLGALACILLVAVVATFALRKSEGGVLGALNRLLAGGFALSVLRTTGEALDLTSDSVALWDVLSNDDLRAFHTTYLAVYVIAAIVSLYALAKRMFELRRKYRMAKIRPSKFEEEEEVAAVSQEALQTFLAEADERTAGLEKVAAVEVLKSEVAERFAIENAQYTQRVLEARAVELRDDVEQKRLTVLVLCFEDLTFMGVNLWMMSANPSEVSQVLLFSFAFNCVMLGLKLPDVRELAKKGALRLKALAKLKKERSVVGKLNAAREERRRSISTSTTA